MADGPAASLFEVRGGVRMDRAPRRRLSDLDVPAEASSTGEHISPLVSRPENPRGALAAAAATYALYER